VKLFLEIKDKLFYFLENTDIGEGLVVYVKKKLGRLPVVDLSFPTSINLEITSLCNLSCIHCPSHLSSAVKNRKPHGLMTMGLFSKAMDEIDSHGITRLALHKDGEPLLHPEILTILSRVKQNQSHFVTVITNGQLLTDEISDALLNNHIDSIMFSIGAASRSFYEKVRGSGFELVSDNIQRFLKKCEKYQPQPIVTVQIINLPEFPEMEAEIRQFKNFWKRKPVTVMVYDKLNWGLFDSDVSKIERYPCPSLWRNMFVHWDAKVSACCIDWDQSLVIGDLNEQTIAEIWSGDEIRAYRQAHVNKHFSAYKLCKRCNYWSTISRLDMKRIMKQTPDAL
jgi:radical SAM protein with 4Fe4S-binding SPASM domain